MEENGDMIKRADNQHNKFLRMALAQAKMAARRGEVPVGAVVVKEGRILARGRNEIVSRRDPTAHAEILALRRAAKKLRNERLTGCVLYSTLEPCAMCAGAAVLARVAEVVYGAADRKAGACGSVMNLSRHPKLNHHFKMTGPLMPRECGKLLKSFFRGKRKWNRG